MKRIRPKTMTVATDMIGLLPLLWATGTGADVTRRLVAPLIGGIARQLRDGAARLPGGVLPRQALAAAPPVGGQY